MKNLFVIKFLSVFFALFMVLACEKPELTTDSIPSAVKPSISLEALEKVKLDDGVLVFESKEHLNKCMDEIEKAQKFDYFKNKFNFVSLLFKRKALKDEDYAAIVSSNSLGKYSKMLRIKEDTYGKHIIPSVDFQSLESLLNGNAILKVADEYVNFAAEEIAISKDLNIILKYQATESKKDIPSNLISFHKIGRSSTKEVKLKNAKEMVGDVIVKSYEGTQDKRQYKFLIDRGHNHIPLILGRAYVKITHEKFVSNGFWSWWARRDAPYISMSNSAWNSCLYSVEGNNYLADIAQSCNNCECVEWNSPNYWGALTVWGIFSAKANVHKAGSNNLPDEYNF